MRKNRILLFIFATFCFPICGCGLLLLGGAAVGTGTGAYFYINGEIQGVYSFSLEKVWTACEKTMVDVRAGNVKKTKAISSGKISATINDEQVELTVKYEERNRTTFTIRVGLFGDETVSKFLYDKIRDNISKN
jgi:hypothetical protein